MIILRRAEIKNRQKKKKWIGQNSKILIRKLVGWIQINDTGIDYPVLYHEGDSRSSQYYLYRDYRGNPDDWGSVFIDYRSTESTKSKNVIMHGHHMNDGTMFAGMLKYGRYSIDMDFYKKAPTITFNTPGRKCDIQDNFRVQDKHIVKSRRIL